MTSTAESRRHRLPGGDWNDGAAEHMGIDSHRWSACNEAPRRYVATVCTVDYFFEPQVGMTRS